MKLQQLTTIALLAASCGTAAAQTPEQRPCLGEHHRPPSSLHGVALDAAQEDKVFAIRNAGEPQRREQARSLRRSEQTLRELAASGQYDEARAVTLARSAGAAMAALALLDAREQAQILAVLTPEPRRQAEAQRAQRPPRFDD